MSLCSGQRARFAALILAAVTAAVPLLVTAPAGAATGRLGLTLVDQSQWVVPPTGGGTATFALSLHTTNAPAGATVTVALYTRLRTRSALQQDLTSGPTGYEVTHTTATLASLPPDPHAPGSVDLNVAITTASPTTSGPSGPSLNLGCSAPTGPGTCPGVYPVVVSLHAGGTSTRLTTFLTYSTGSATHPLEFAWVVPASAPVTVRPHASSPARAIAPLSSADATALEGLVADLHASPTVPVTIAPSPETLQALDGDGAAGRTAVATLANLSTDQAVDEVSAAPYVPIDLAALSAGDSGEVSAQMSAGAATLQQLHIATSAPTAWSAADSLDSALATGMTEAHVGLLLVPSTSLTPPPHNNGTWAAPFDLQLAKGTRGTHKGTGPTVTAAAADGTLQRDFSSSRHDPALAATQLLADLAMIHFESPNTRVTRGVVAVPPAGWLPNATFDRVLLEGLAGNPDVSAVTLAKYLATVPSGGTRSVSSSPKGSGPGRDGIKTLVSERTTLSEFENAVPGNPPLVLTQLGQLLLDIEDSQWPASTRSAATSTFHRLLEAQLHLVKFATARTVTLTARTGWIPITVVSSAPYTVVGTLSVNGNEKFVFPNSSSHAMTLDHPTNAWRVDVKARSSGDLALTATFTTPHGTLVIASTTLTVRSTGTSLVGIVLTAVALAVLLAWWARTWWSRRRRSRPGATRILQP